MEKQRDPSGSLYINIGDTVFCPSRFPSAVPLFMWCFLWVLWFRQIPLCFFFCPFHYSFSLFFFFPKVFSEYLLFLGNTGVTDLAWVCSEDAFLPGLWWVTLATVALPTPRPVWSGSCLGYGRQSSPLCALLPAVRRFMQVKTSLLSSWKAK